MSPDKGNESSRQQFQGSQPNSNGSTAMNTMNLNGTLGTNGGDTTANNHYINQMIMSHPSLLSQHHGTQNPILYQNSLLDVANMMPMINQSTNMSSHLPINNHDSLRNAVTTATPPNFHNLHHNNSSSTPIPFISTAQQVQIAAAAAAAEAAPSKGYHGLSTAPNVRNHDAISQSIDMNEPGGKSPSNKRTKRTATTAELTEEEKRQLNRDRNRHHARSTRLRKKAYVNKLKELVDGLHAERSEEARKRRVAVQHLTEVQNVRRKVIIKFLQFHSAFEYDRRKWETILEDKFFLKQPLTPFRSFRSHEIEQTKNDRVCLLLVLFIVL